MEMDFFTAVDDLNPEETAGAGMMGFTGFDSACFYRYARIDWTQLVENLSDDTGLARRAVEGFLRAAVAAVPSGKQNSFAANNPPSLLLAVVRQDGMGWSLANAFERPVSGRGNDGLISPSTAALDTYWGRLCQLYGTDTLVCTAALALDPDLPLEALKDAQVESLDAWVGAVTDALPVQEDI
jgi:CRISPR system Cascade subunit CasC